MAVRRDFPRVQLKGSSIDLENLAVLLRDGDHRVSLQDGLYWLLSEEFLDAATDPDCVRRKALELLPVVNGAAKLVFPQFEPVELGQCVDWVQPNGRLKRRLTETIEVRIRSGVRVAEDGQSLACNKAIQDWTTLALEDERVSDVLRLWASTPVHDWDGLYKLKEKIEAAVGGSEIILRGWATKGDLRLFDHTANSPAVLGASARHGVQSGMPPTKPMTLREAQLLIERLIRGWLDEVRSGHLG